MAPSRPFLAQKQAASAQTEKDKEGKPKFIPAWNWRSTTGPDKIYIEIFSWPKGNFHLDNCRMKSPVHTCWRTRIALPSKSRSQARVSTSFCRVKPSIRPQPFSCFQRNRFRMRIPRP